MDITKEEVLRALQAAPAKESVDKLLAKVEGIEGKLAELDRPNPAPMPADKPVARMAESGILGGIVDQKIWDIPVGQAAVGGFVAVFASELVDGLLAKQSDMTRGVVKLAVAGIAVKWGSRYLGTTAGKAVALLLAFDAIRDIVPIDTWADKAAEKLTGVVTLKGLAGPGRGTPAAVQQADKVAKDYYARAMGR